MSERPAIKWILGVSFFSDRENRTARTWSGQSTVWDFVIYSQLCFERRSGELNSFTANHRTCVIDVIMVLQMSLHLHRTIVHFDSSECISRSQTELSEILSSTANFVMKKELWLLLPTQKEYGKDRSHCLSPRLPSTCQVRQSVLFVRRWQTIPHDIFIQSFLCISSLQEILLHEIMPGSEWTRNICRGESDVNVSDGFKTSGPWQKVLGTRNGKFFT